MLTSQRRRHCTGMRQCAAVHAVIVVPCFNEEQRLAADAFRAFRVDGHRVDFCFVDDGSTDNTIGVLNALRESDPSRFSVLRLQKNSGKAEAVRRGMLEAAGGSADVVGFWDADLATPLSELAGFLKILT